VMSRLPEGGDPDDPEFQDDMQECGDEAGLDGIAGGPASGASEDEDR